MLSFAILYLCLPAFACVCYNRAYVNAIFLPDPQWISTMCIRHPPCPKRIQILSYLVKGSQWCMLHHCTGQGLLLLILALYIRNTQQETPANKGKKEWLHNKQHFTETVLGKHSSKWSLQKSIFSFHDELNSSVLPVTFILDYTTQMLAQSLRQNMTLAAEGCRQSRPWVFFAAISDRASSRASDVLRFMGWTSQIHVPRTRGDHSISLNTSCVHSSHTVSKHCGAAITIICSPIQKWNLFLS